MNRDVEYNMHTGDLTIRLTNRYDDPRKNSSGSELSSLGGQDLTFSELITLDRSGAKLSWQQNTNIQALVTSFLSVPNNLVGGIFGVGGSKIRKICQISGAKIKISKAGPTYKGDRTIRVVGNQKAVSIAEYAIKKSVKQMLKSFLEGKKPYYQRLRDLPRSAGGPLIPTLFSLNEAAGFPCSQNKFPNKNCLAERFRYRPYTRPI